MATIDKLNREITLRVFNGYHVRLIESMLMECLEDPRPLLTSTLGRNHPLIVAARQRPPPSDEGKRSICPVG